VKRVRFTAPARREYLVEIAYYKGKELSLGFRFANAVEEAAARAATFPDSGSPASKNTRRVYLKDFPFSVVYRVDKHGILIFALAHHSRAPDYWQSRIQDR
jgi:toxin ParE1/3/4